MALPVIGAAITAGLTYLTTGSLILSLVFGALTLVSSLYVQKPKTKQLKPASVSDFSINQANENIPIPLIYGKVRLPGNILWYGNLISEPVYNKVGGKDDLGEKKVLTGYDYYLDLWIGLCYGDNVHIEEIIIDNDPSQKKELPIQKENLAIGIMASPAFNASNVYFNTDVSAHLNLEYTPLYHHNKINHVFFKKFFVGYNRTHLQTIYFVLRRELTTPLNYNSIYKNNQFIGCNPIAVLYDLLVNQAHIPPSLIDLNSWNEVAAYYQQQQLGINLAITSEKKLNDLVEEILKFIGAYIFYTDEGKIGIRVIHYNEHPVDTIVDEFLDFNFLKKSWIDIPNKFVGVFIDPEANWTERTIIVENPTGKKLAGKSIIENIDLSYLIDREAAAKKLQDIMKQYSFPRNVIECTVPLKYAHLQVGQIVTIVNNNLGIKGDFRIISINESNLKEGKLRLTLLQYDEKIINPNYVQIYTPPPPIIDTAPVNFSKIRILEISIPEFYTKWGFPVFLFLVAREQGTETGYIIYYSTDGTNFQTLKICSTFSTYGTLLTELPAHTFETDFDSKIEIACYKTFDIRLFSNISRKDLFEPTRSNILVVNNEILAFQNIFPVPDAKNRIQISGLIRKLLLTRQENHLPNTPVWLTKFADNIVEMPVLSNTYYFKIAPLVGNKTIGDLSLLPTFRVTNNFLTLKPIISRIEVQRSGNSISVTVFPIAKASEYGAGYKPEIIYSDVFPLLEGTILYKISSNEPFNEVNSNTFSFTKSGSFTLQIQLKYKNFYSEPISLFIPDQDGVYIYSL